MDDLILKVLEQSPVIGLLGVIAYKLRQDLHDYVKMCHDDNRELMQRILALLERNEVQ
jgi:hypothetical protein